MGIFGKKQNLKTVKQQQIMEKAQKLQLRPYNNNESIMYSHGKMQDYARVGSWIPVVIFVTLTIIFALFA